MARELQHGGKKHTGKQPLTFSKFEWLAEKSLLLPDGGFTQLFLIMTWNLMCRSQSTETIRCDSRFLQHILMRKNRFDHISYEDDAIGVTFFKTKTQQEGVYYSDQNVKTLG